MITQPKTPTWRQLEKLAAQKGATLQPAMKWTQVYEVTFTVVRPTTFIHPSKHYRKGVAMQRAWQALSALSDAKGGQR